MKRALLAAAGAAGIGTAAAFVATRLRELDDAFDIDLDAPPGPAAGDLIAYRLALQLGLTTTPPTGGVLP